MTHLAPICFYKQTTLRTETFTLNNLSAQIPLHCYTQRFVHRLTLTRRRLYTQMLLRKKIASVLHKDAFAQQKRHAGAFTHRTLYAEKLLHRTTFAQKKLHKKTLTQKNVSTETAQKIYTPKLLRAETLPRTTFTQKKSAQKPLCTAVFTRTFSHTDALTQKIFHTQKLVHTIRFYTQPFFAQRGFASLS